MIPRRIRVYGLVVRSLERGGAENEDVGSSVRIET